MRGKLSLVDVPDIFYFFCSGDGKGESEGRRGGGGTIFHGKFQERGARGREGV